MSFFRKESSLQEKEKQMKQVSVSLDKNINFIRTQLCDTEDLLMKEITWNEHQGMLVYLNTMINSDQFQRIFLAPITEMNFGEQMDNLVASPEMNQTNDLNNVVNDLLSGSVAIFIESEPTCYLFNIIQSNPRSPDEPDSEKIVRGAHNGFIENFDVNLNIIRERVKNRHLKIEYFTLGKEENSTVAMIYLHNVVNETLVQKVRKRINANNSDMVFSPGYLEEDIEDSPASPFPQVLYTERPDRVQANLIEGRIAIINEGSADVSILPVTFFAFFQSPDDYNLRTYSGSFFRLLRLFCFLGALTLPALYIAVVSFHFEFIPDDLIGLMKASITNIPFSPLIEAGIMAITIELVREAGIRLPTPIGQTIGIVGGLIIGDAVVNAGLVSNLMVIVIALTAIMSFCIPTYEMGNTVRLLGFPLMIGAATLGFVGIVFALMIIIIHLCTLESFGIPYLSPLTPTHFSELQDAILRLPNWMQKTRPENLRTKKPLKEGKSRGWKSNDK